MKIKRISALMPLMAVMILSTGCSIIESDKS